ncbi:hypothetical protein A9W96_19095 [Mycobacterium sp. 1245852.3]|nr:hypothetical protein A9W96_19095 [Mycobacterium sp. 1245852.3]
MSDIERRRSGGTARDLALDVAVILHKHPNWILALTAALGPGFGTFLVTVGQSLHDRGDYAYVGGGIFVIILSGLLQVAKQWASANVTAIDGLQADAYIVAMKDALQPIAKLVADMPAMNAQDRSTQLIKVASQATGALVLLLCEVRSIRATVYRINAQGDQMDCISYHGRAGGQRRPFRRDDEKTDENTGGRGAAAFRLVEAGEPRFVPDIRDRNHPHMSDFRGTGDGYNTFITVGINTSNEAYGMISVDAPRANSLVESDIHAVSLVADLLASAFAMAEDGDQGLVAKHDA